MGNPTIKAQTTYLYQNLANNSRTLIALASDGTGANSLTNDVLYWNGSGTPTNLFTPSAGASVPYMAYSRDYAYFADGEAADLYKWDINSSLYTWGIAAPTTAPNVFATSSATGGTWNASTIFSTMGIIVDGNGNLQQLVSINATNTNTSTTLGKSGVGQPSWNATPGGTTTDTPVTWTNKGPIGVWQQSHFFSEGHFGYGTLTNPAIIYDPNSDALYFNNQGGGGTSGTSYPGFKPVVGAITIDGTCRWEFLGLVATATSTGTIGTWTNSTFFPTWGSTNNFTNTAVTEPTTVQAAYNTISSSFNQTLYLQAATTGGTTPATETAPAWATTAGQYTDDGQLRWLCLGTASPSWPFTATAWGPNSTSFSALKDTHSNIQVCITGGTTGGSSPGFPSSYTAPGSYGQETTDGATVVWAAVGPTVAWAANTIWYLPNGGFVAPASTAQYGGANIIDTNNVLEACTQTGKSGSTPPAWPAVGSNVTDNAVVWLAVENITGVPGNITLLKGRYYYVIYVNSITQGMSDLSPVSAFTGAINSGQVYLSNIPVSPDSQVDQKIILTTADGGDPTTLYWVATITNATTTFSDNTSAQSVLLNNIYQQTDSYGNLIGVIGNDPPPPAGLYPTLHQGRVWLAAGQYVYFSKALSDVFTSSGIIAGRYEECFPPENSLDVAPGSEEIHGMLSDGTTLYIGTERHIRRVTGSDPTSFSTPQVIFSESGVLNQRVWQIIFREGTPIGSMWMTPDFRVIYSDFNTYQDSGTPIQPILNSINPAAAQNCFANMVSYGPYNFYVLGIPTGSNTACDTLLIADLHTQKWYVWQPADSMLSGVFYFNLAGIPRWMTFSADGTIRFWDQTLVVDKQNEADATPIQTTVQTTWLPFGDPSMRKVLNFIEVMTSDPNMTITVEAAQTNADFLSPTVLVSNATLTTDIFNQLKVMLVGIDTLARYFRITFKSTSNVQTSTIADHLLSYYSVSFAPLNRN